MPGSGYPLNSHFQIPCVFPVYSLSNRKFSLCQFTSFLTITNTKLTKQTYPAFKRKRISHQILKYILPLESGNLQFEQTNFLGFSLCFGKISKFPVLSLIWNFVPCFPYFPCAVGTLTDVCFGGLKMDLF